MKRKIAIYIDIDTDAPSNADPTRCETPRPDLADLYVKPGEDVPARYKIYVRDDVKDWPLFAAVVHELGHALGHAFGFPGQKGDPRTRSSFIDWPWLSREPNLSPSERLLRSEEEAWAIATGFASGSFEQAKQHFLGSYYKHHDRGNPSYWAGRPVVTEAERSQQVPVLRPLSVPYFDRDMIEMLAKILKKADEESRTDGTTEPSV